MTISIDHVLSPCNGAPDSPWDTNSEPLRVTVLFNTIPGTLTALDAAARFAQSLGGEISLLVAEEIYFRYSLEHPPVSASFFQRLCFALTEELMVDPCDRKNDHDIAIEIRFCRNQIQCLQLSLKPRSLLLVGTKRRWWPQRERKLQRALSHLGHDVILIPASPKFAQSSRSVVNRLLSEVSARSS